MVVIVLTILLAACWQLWRIDAAHAAGCGFCVNPTSPANGSTTASTTVTLNATVTDDSFPGDGVGSFYVCAVADVTCSSPLWTAPWTGVGPVSAMFTGSAGTTYRWYLSGIETSPPFRGDSDLIPMWTFTTPGGGVSSSVTVSASIASQISLTNNCTNPFGYQLGTVLPGSTSLTSTSPATACRLDFQSNNDSAMLRLWQGDRTGSAMAATNPTWAIQSGGTFYDNLAVAVAPGSPATAFMGTHGGKMLRTTTTGSTWPTSYSIPSMADVNGVAASDTNNVVAVGPDRYIWRSTNASGAFTFSDICTGNCLTITATHDMGSVAMGDANHIYVGTRNGELLVTADGGTTWSLPPSGVVAGIYGMQVVPGTDDVYAATSGGNLVKTIDGSAAGGGTWAKLNAGSFGSAFRDVAVVRVATTDYIYAPMDDGRILRGVMTDTDMTTGGGVWTALDPGVHRKGGGGYAVVALDKDTVRVSNDRGEIWETPNATAGSPTWTYMYTGTGNAAVSMDNSGSTIYAAQVGAQVSVSADSGTTWSTTTATGGTARNTHNDIAMIGVRCYMAASFVPAAFNLKYTTNGSTWNALSSGANGVNLFGVALGEQVPSGTVTGIAVGSGGTIVRSTDAFAGSPTWAPIASPTTSDLYDVAFAPKAQVAWAVGEAGTIIQTTDGGATWVTQASGVNTTALTGVVALDESTAFVVGTGGTVLRTTDGGASWSTLTSGTPANLYGVSITDPGTLYVAGDSATVRRSTNALAPAPGAVTFTSVSPPAIAGSLRAIATPGEGTIIVAGVGGAVARSDDGGATYAITYQTARRLVGVAAVERTSSWIAGEGGRIYGALPPASMPDYAAGNQWGTGGAPGLFGVCVQAATGTADWAVDTGGTAGLCEANDADAWHAIPTSPTKTVHTTAAGAAGSMTFVWGMRPAANQAPGSYAATVVFEALAPNV